MLRQIFFYSKSIFINAKIHQDYVPFAVIGTNAVNVLMTFVAVRYFQSKPSFLGLPGVRVPHVFEWGYRAPNLHHSFVKFS